MRERRKDRSGESSRRDLEEETFTADHEFSHLTKLRSEPCEKTQKGIQNGRKMPIPTVKMLSGREVNCSGRGRFSSADCSHVLGRYLPVNGPWYVDEMDSRAYVSQFSADGSLLVAGFQGSDIRIYNVDKGFKLKKSFIAKSLRWTITDTCLSPDQRYLVYASMSPIVHIVNVESAAAESHANITDIHDGLDFSAHEDVRYSFGIFSVKFSTDGRELVAGTNDDAIYVYDLETNRLTSRFAAHEDKVLVLLPPQSCRAPEHHLRLSPQSTAATSVVEHCRDPTKSSPSLSKSIIPTKSSKPYPSLSTTPIILVQASRLQSEPPRLSKIPKSSSTEIFPSPSARSEPREERSERRG